ncbi:methyltransferase domain-containing protein [Methylophaga sp.]|jgi:predicted methyltransferase|uniref:class I SAM-dependent methyltransferase n=1 Tax=Methylophaga sp. TaxID=2024840 RepID=UPI0025DE1CCE|nr:methyltransferase domain-containing protein [Methylophaga sp.]
MTLVPQLGFSADIQSILQHPDRNASNALRDKYRHPAQTLSFFGIRADMSVIEIWPGKGWYTEVLAPWIKQGDGQFIAAGFPQDTGPEWRQNMQAEYESWLDRFPDRFNEVDVVEFGPPGNWRLGPDNSVDAVLTFRNVHNWVKGEYADRVFKAMFDVLKPGGILGLTDHRARPGADIDTMNASGYLTEQLVIDLARQAGFVLEEKSEINSNPKDSKNHPAGVWTLPPTLRMGEQENEKYLAIGESDRMTLRFRKPLD